MGEATELVVVVHGAPDEPGALGLERLEELVVGLGGVDEPLSALEGDDLAVSGLEEPVDEEELSDVLRELDGLAEVLGLETLAALWAGELDELDDSSAEDLFEPMPELEGLDELLDPEVPESELDELDEPDAPGGLDDGDDSDELDCPEGPVEAVVSEGPEDSVVVVLEGLDEEEVDLEWDEPEPDELEGLDVDVLGGLDDGEGELCDVDKAGRGLEELDVVLVVESEELEELGVLCAPDDGAGELEVSELGDEFEQVPAPLVSLEDVAPKVGIVHAAVAITKAAPAPMNLPRFAITPLLPDVGTLPRRWGLTYPRQCPVDASRRCTCKETSTRWSSRGVAAGCWPAMTYQ